MNNENNPLGDIPHPYSEHEEDLEAHLGALHSGRNPNFYRIPGVPAMSKDVLENLHREYHMGLPSEG